MRPGFGSGWPVTRTQMRLSYRTGGESAGHTVTTATSTPLSFRFSANKVGGGRILPSVLMPVSCSRGWPPMDRPHGVPLSWTPTNNAPGRLWLARSLAKAQTASVPLLAGIPVPDLLEFHPITLPARQQLLQCAGAVGLIIRGPSLGYKGCSWPCKGKPQRVHPG